MALTVGARLGHYDVTAFIGERGAMLRAYDKATGQERGAVTIPAAQTRSPMIYLHDGEQHLVVAVCGGATKASLSRSHFRRRTVWRFGSVSLHVLVSASPSSPGFLGWRRSKAPPIWRELPGRKWEVIETEDWPSSALSAVGLHTCVYRD